MKLFDKKLLLAAVLTAILAGCSGSSSKTPDPRDADGDGIPAYPYGTDLDDDGDGYLNRLVGGSDVNDSAKKVGLTGIGTGVFENAIAYQGAEDDPEDMGVGDFNNDGYIDIYALESSKNSLIVHLNLGNRKFSSGIHYPLYDGSIDDSYTTVGDFNKDGNLDVVLVDSSSGDNDNILGTDGIHIVWGDGTGYFTKMTNVIPDAAEYHTAQTVDFNEDGNLDIAVSDESNDQITIIFGDGDRTFDDTLDRVDLATTAGLDAINIGDINGDGHMDLIALTNDGSSTISTFLGNGKGGFGKEKVTTLTKNNHNGDDMAVGDFDADGKLDLLVGSSGNSEGIEIVIFLKGSGNGKFSDESEVFVGGYSSEHIYNAGDLNGDGHLDAIVADDGEEDVSILLGKGNGKFKVGALVQSYDAEVAGVGIADFDGDGVTDISFYRDDTDPPTGLFIWYGLASTEGVEPESDTNAQAKGTTPLYNTSNIIDLNRSSHTADYSYTFIE